MLDNELNLIKIIENCYNDQLKFHSLYWMDENGFVWKSKQWLGNKVNAEITILKLDKTYLPPLPNNKNERIFLM